MYLCNLIYSIVIRYTGLLFLDSCSSILYSILVYLRTYMLSILCGVPQLLCNMHSVCTRMDTVGLHHLLFRSYSWSNCCTRFKRNKCSKKMNFIEEYTTSTTSMTDKYFFLKKKPIGHCTFNALPFESALNVWEKVLLISQLFRPECSSTVRPCSRGPAECCSSSTILI